MAVLMLGWDGVMVMRLSELISGSGMFERYMLKRVGDRTPALMFVCFDV